MFVLRDFLEPEECARLRAAIDASPLTPAEVLSDTYCVDARARRTLEADVAPQIVADVEQALASVRARVSAFFDMRLVAAEGPGFLRYTPGSFYGPHRDVIDPEGDRFPRRISVIVFLSSATDVAGEGACEGGTLRVYGEEGLDGPPRAEIAPFAGTLVAFPSDVLHEVLPVTGASGMRSWTGSTDVLWVPEPGRARRAHPAAGDPVDPSMV